MNKIYTKCVFEFGNGISFVKKPVYSPPLPRPAVGPPDQHRKSCLKRNSNQQYFKCILPCQGPPPPPAPPRPAPPAFGPPPPLPLPRAAAKEQFRN